MKKLVWFKEEDLIPDDAKYITSEKRYVAIGSGVTYLWHLYEVPVKEGE